MNRFEEINTLREREKELMCLYKADNILGNFSTDIQKVLKELAFEIPKGWQFPAISSVRISTENSVVTSGNFSESSHFIKADIITDNKSSGKIEVFYSDNKYSFLPEESKLLSALAQRIGNHLFHRKIKELLNGEPTQKTDSEHWKWRNEMVTFLSEKTDFMKFSIKGIYIIGSVKNASSTQHSDIDLIIHISNDKPNKELSEWMSGWSHCLAEMNRIKTGVSHPDGLLDIHYITDKDFISKSSYASMIGSNENSAKPVKILSQ